MSNLYVSNMCLLGALSSLHVGCAPNHSPSELCSDWSGRKALAPLSQAFALAKFVPIWASIACVRLSMVSNRVSSLQLPPQSLELAKQRNMPKGCLLKNTSDARAIE
jgi:hypothetical protein